VAVKSARSRVVCRKITAAAEEEEDEEACKGLRLHERKQCRVRGGMERPQA
jgi:hypothetical protein